MPRPPKPRRVRHRPGITYFKPAGVPLRDLEEVVLTVDEVEALRLKDVEGLDQDACARQMGVAQSTLQRILAGARTKLSRAIVQGKAVRIEGGFVEFIDHPGPGTPGPGRWGRRARRGRGGRQGRGGTTG